MKNNIIVFYFKKKKKQNLIIINLFFLPLYYFKFSFAIKRHGNEKEDISTIKIYLCQHTDMSVQYRLLSIY